MKFHDILLNLQNSLNTYGFKLEVIYMVSLNITLPDNIVDRLSKTRDISRFIAIALEEKFKREKKKDIEILLVKGYKATLKEDAELQSNWENAGLEKWD
jgi:hypothetical protein